MHLRRAGAMLRNFANWLGCGWPLLKPKERWKNSPFTLGLRVSDSRHELKINYMTNILSPLQQWDCGCRPRTLDASRDTTFGKMARRWTPVCGTRATRRTSEATRRPACFSSPILSLPSCRTGPAPAPPSASARWVLHWRTVSLENESLFARQNASLY